MLNPIASHVMPEAAISRRYCIRVMLTATAARSDPRRRWKRLLLPPTPEKNWGRAQKLARQCSNRLCFKPLGLSLWTLANGLVESM
ncbi:hypothetical protein ASPCADRAFT_131278 [Aspergillus carbonarius ITEM 5010]|uniref:Uncharacterized protein n=1 Tax=Aspergillus carbonarius (strain ITEM 5010) TaxID=602072 RepID=A0A1R3RJJ9_ASPC5|nr:hypothetical protein ASPCADRAFT_131278 [Aspergillus carbonarius ITEM 5010]